MLFHGLKFFFILTLFFILPLKSDEVRAESNRSQDIRFLCSGLSSAVGQGSGDFSININELSAAQQQGELSFYQGGSLISSLEDFTYTDYRQCVLDMSELLFGVAELERRGQVAIESNSIGIVELSENDTIVFQQEALTCLAR